MPLPTYTRYLLLSSFRDKLFGGMFAAILVASMLSAAIGNTAFLENREMTLVFAGSAARFVLALGLSVFICFHIRHQFDSREIDVMLSRPVSRARLVLEYWLGFAFCALLLILPTLVILALAGIKSLGGYAAWGMSLLLETWIVASVALALALIVKSAVSAVLASLGFYVFARIAIYFLLTAESAFAASKDPMLKYILHFVSLFMPRLDLFAKSEWLVYGSPSFDHVMLILLQAAIYVPLLLAVSVIDFRRKQF